MGIEEKPSLRATLALHCAALVQLFHVGFLGQYLQELQFMDTYPSMPCFKLCRTSMIYTPNLR